MKNTKERIGILTLSASDNCGSLLQTYALQKTLINEGYENVEIIDFQSEISKKMYDIFPKDIFLQPRKLFLSIIRYKLLKKQKRDYDLFRSNELLLSKEKYTSALDIENMKDNYDIVICGSDQIWNVCMRDFDEAFFLPNVKNIRKIAYAASLGGKSFKNYNDIEKIKQWLADFDKISVRESVGREEVLSIYNGEVEVLADPTLLLEEAEWIKIVGSERLVTEDYIFYYSWSYGNKRLMEVVQRISEELGKKVYVINASKWLIHSYKKYGFYLCKEGGPYAFANLMYYADLVFVESLHGTIFSTIFKKNFWYLNSFSSGNIDQRNEYFLGLLNMSNRIINIDDDIELKDIQQKICYEENENLKKLREKSINWIKDVV